MKLNVQVKGIACLFNTIYLISQISLSFSKDQAHNRYKIIINDSNLECLVMLVSQMMVSS